MDEMQRPFGLSLLAAGHSHVEYIEGEAHFPQPWRYKYLESLGAEKRLRGFAVFSPNRSQWLRLGTLGRLPQCPFQEYKIVRRDPIRRFR